MQNLRNKLLTRTMIYALMASMSLTAALAIPAATQQQVPFKGALQGTDKDGALNFSILQVSTSGTGTGAHLGEFSFTEEIALNVVAGPRDQLIGSRRRARQAR